MKSNHKTLEEKSTKYIIIKLLKASNKGEKHPKSQRKEILVFTESSKDKYVNRFLVQNNEWNQEDNGTMSL